MLRINGRLFHIGRKAPKGYKELPGAIHLGKGIWIIPIEKVVTE